MQKFHIVSALVISVLSAGVRAELVTHYSFDGNALDSSGHGNNAVVHGASLAPDRFGSPNRAYSFDGIDDYISASASGLPIADRTVAFWFDASTFSNHPVMLGYGGGGCGSGFFIGANATKSIYNDRLYVSSHCDINNLLFHYSTPPIGAWMHFAMTTSIEGTKMYLNGDLVDSNSTYINNTIVSGKALAIGVDTSPNGSAPYTDVNVKYYSGIMDDVQIYNTALDAQQIKDLLAVPEPSPEVLVLLGLSMIGIGARWKSPGACDQHFAQSTPPSTPSSRPSASSSSSSRRL